MRHKVERFFRSFHMMLFLPYPVGTYVAGAFGVLLLSSMTAALFFYKRWWRRFLHVRLGHGVRALWSELHKAAGLWSLWFVLLIGLTGVWYFVEQLGTDLIDPDFAYPPDPEFASRSASPLPLDDLVARGDVLLGDGDLNLTKLVLTFAVPYCVATYGAESYRMAMLRQAQTNETDDAK